MTEMTPEAQRIAIAEACGWETKAPLLSGVPPTAKGKAWAYVEPLPNYLNDLNTMHEAENVVSDDKKQLYLNLLSSKVGNDGITGFPVDVEALEETMFLWRIHLATATQRAEAFLRTIGKWIE